MTHCLACSFDGNEKSVEKHQRERRHQGICEGKWERVKKQSGLFQTQDSQLICWKCGQHCVKPNILY